MSTRRLPSVLLAAGGALLLFSAGSVEAAVTRPAGWVAVAAAVLVLFGAWRRVVASLAGLVAVGAAVAVIADFSVTAAAVTALVGAVTTTVGSVAAFRATSQPPSRRSEGDGDQGPLDLWQAMDRGEDPTRDSPVPERPVPGPDDLPQ